MGIIRLTRSRTLPAAACLLIAIAAGGCATAAPAAREQSAPPAGLPDGVTVEAGMLKFRGAVIHPGAVSDLMRRPGAIPTTAAVDLEGCQASPKYGVSRPQVQGAAVRWRRPEVAAADPASSSYFEYELIGVTPRGVHVLKTAEWSGGSSVHVSLVLVRFQAERILADDKTRRRVVMECVGEISLGARYGGRIELAGDLLKIGWFSPGGTAVTEAREIHIDAP